MQNPKESYFEKRAQMLLKNLRARRIEAFYCPDSASALEQALALIPEGASVGWGGSATLNQIGLLEAVNKGPYMAIDRDKAASPEERKNAMRQALLADVFLTSANAISMDGQLVNIDGMGNRVAAIVWGPESVIVVAGMNKVTDTLEDAYRRAKTVAAPMNMQRFSGDTPCRVTGMCGECKSPSGICNQILVTRGSNPAGRIKVILVGENLGM